MRRALYASAFGQGARPSEVPLLRWEGVDWARGTVHVPGKKTTRSNRIVPLLALPARELHRWWVACGRPADGAVFVRRGAPIGEWTRGYRAALKRAGLATPGRRLIRYSARHTFAADGVLKGRADAVSAELMGHAPGSRVTQRVYQRLRPDQVRQALGDAVWTPSMSGGS